MTRTYTSTELATLVTRLQMYTIVCHTVAPVSPVVFKWIHFKIFGLEINQYNFIGLFLAVCTMIYQTVAFCLLSDLSKEPGYRVYLKLNNQVDIFVDELKEPRASEKPLKESWCPSKEKTTSNLSIEKEEQHLKEDEKSPSGKTAESFHQSVPRKRQNPKQRKVCESGDKMLTLSDVFTNRDLVLILATAFSKQFIYTQCEIAVRYYCSGCFSLVDRILGNVLHSNRRYCRSNHEISSKIQR